MKDFLFCLFIGFSLIHSLHSQVYTNVVVGEKNAELKDSIQQSEYPYALPIWGEKATALGYDLPYSAGLGLNYIIQESDLIISNLQVGFNNGPLYNIDEIIRFDDAIARASAVNIRPDIWLFPFLNVYGIIAQAKTSTEISAGVWIPDSSGVWSEISSFSTKANFDATSLGFGITPTMGVGGGWMALDMNFVWTDVSALDQPVKTFVFGPRFGKTFKFKKPENNVALWVGGFRVKFSSSTSGSLPLSDLIPTDELQGKVDQGIISVGEKQMNVDEWWEGLSQVEQNNPINQAKYETANRTLDLAGNVLNSVDGALNDEQTASVQYSLEKKLKDAWNFIVGAQYQLNKHWMIRAEFGFLGSREQFIGGLQYRFPL